MSEPMSFPTPPTEAEIDAAERLGVGLDLYRQLKRNAGAAGDRLEQGDGPADVVKEQHLADKLRREPGIFKARNTAPNVLVAAARTPGEVAQTLLTIFCYLALMFLVVGFGGERVQRIPGVFQVAALGLLLIPAMMLSSAIWRGLGEGVRDTIRALIRFWPLTFVALIFLLGLLRMALG